jgi:multicomponent Na+:H+ antiporter subunit G
MTGADIAYVIGAIAVVLGSLFCLLAALGIVRLPDLFTRMHATSKAGAVGSGLLLVGVAIVSFDAAIALRAVLGILFLLLTTPVSAHLLARAAYRSGLRPIAHVNDLHTDDSEI